MRHGLPVRHACSHGMSRVRFSLIGLFQGNCGARHLRSQGVADVHGYRGVPTLCFSASRGAHSERPNEFYDMNHPG